MAEEEKTEETSGNELQDMAENVADGLLADTDGSTSVEPSEGQEGEEASDEEQASNAEEGEQSQEPEEGSEDGDGQQDEGHEADESSPPAEPVSEPERDASEPEESDEEDQVLKDLREDLGDDLAGKIDRLAELKAEKAAKDLRKEAEAKERELVELDRQAELLSQAAKGFPKASDEHLRLAAKMVRTGCVEVKKGTNPYQAALSQLNIPTDKKTTRPRATRQERETAAAMASDQGGSSESPESGLDGLDDDSILRALENRDPVFAGLLGEDQ